MVREEYDWVSDISATGSIRRQHQQLTRLKVVLSASNAPMAVKATIITYGFAASIGLAEKSPSPKN